MKAAVDDYPPWLMSLTAQNMAKKKKNRKDKVNCTVLTQLLFNHVNLIDFWGLYYFISIF